MRYDLSNRKAFVNTVCVLLLTLGALSATPCAIAAEHSVTNISFNPSTPNILVHNKDVKISFSYATTQAGGVRIYTRPFVGNALAPNYAASGSPLYPTSTGTGSGTFTIKTGTVTVDRIRIQMWNANQTTLLFEAFLPVHFQFRAP